MSRIINADCLDALKDLEDDSIDLIATDPPYGYSFMGKDWDKAVPSVEIWQECLRVLKPGAFCFVMSAPRSDVQMHMITNLTEAGFRLDFTPIYWTYASGFPKAGNIGKLVDKRLGADRNILGIAKKRGKAPSMLGKSDPRSENYDGTTLGVGTSYITDPSTSEAKALDGSYAGYQPKPAVEVVIVAMKPLSEKTYVDQAMKNGKGITWLDDVRVPTGELPQTWNGASNPQGYKENSGGNFKPDAVSGSHVSGRFPANLLVSDDVLNDGTNRKSTGGTNGANSNVYSKYGSPVGEAGLGGYGDSGSYSRYFDLDKWASTLPFLIVPKASKREKNEGLDGMVEKPKPTMSEWKANSPGRTAPKDSNTPRANFHPTVKPLKLMQYLITLGSRKGDKVLDPFVGSGTTAVAAKQLGRIPIGIERDPEYAEIARARLDHVVRQGEQVSLVEELKGGKQ
jgi:DNA modification methylase